MAAYNEAYQKSVVTGIADFGMGLIMGKGALNRLQKQLSKKAH